MKFLSVSLILLLPLSVLNPQLSFASSVAVTAPIPSGYEKIPWGSDIGVILRKYPNGDILKTGNNRFVYRQNNPASSWSRRLFGFEEGKLNVVSISFGKSYVQKKGIENILAEQKKLFGECEMDTSQAPDMLHCKWENRDTRITLGYAPLRHDMTVLIYDRLPINAPPP